MEDTKQKITNEKDAEVEEMNKASNEKKKNQERYAEFYEDEPYVVKSVGQKKKINKVIRVIAASLFGLIAIVYFGGVIYFNSHFAGTTTLNNYDISWKHKKNAKALLDTKLSEYRLDVVFKDGRTTICVGDGDMAVSLAKSVNEIKKCQNPWAWPVNIFQDFSYNSEYVVTYDQEKMRQFLNDTDYMKAENMLASTNARVRMTNGEVVVMPDVTGTKLDEKLVFACVFDALDNHRELADLDANGCYVPAVITMTSDCIERGVLNATSFLNAKLTYDFNGYEIPISKEDLSTLAYVDTNGLIKLSEQNVDAYARKFAREKSTCYTYRDFKTHDGNMISVYGGWFGWQLDEEKCAADLKDALNQILDGKNNIKLEPAYTHEGYSYGEMNDIGNTYVEVDLTDQHVYVYVDGKLVIDTLCVTGNKRKGMTTPGGLYGITGKGYKVTLIGDDYETPVTYWMPFNGGIGLHDATWRGTFGGDIYTYDGSHGCVNLPYKAAAEIYGVVEVGMPVVCYWE